MSLDYCRDCLQEVLVAFLNAESRHRGDQKPVAPPELPAEFASGLRCQARTKTREIIAVRGGDNFRLRHPLIPNHRPLDRFRSRHDVISEEGMPAIDLTVKRAVELRGEIGVMASHDPQGGAC